MKQNRLGRHINTDLEQTRHFKVTLTSATGKEFHFFYDKSRSTLALLAGIAQGGYIANVVNAKVEEV